MIKDKTKEPKTKKKQSTANRGKEFEKLINNKCEEYKKKGIANIYKVPTDWVVIRNGARIVTAYPREKAIVDYLGDYNGRSLAIEVKQTDNKTSFPFANIKDHQFDFFKIWKGLKYYIIWFKTLEETYLVQADLIEDLKNDDDRKSATIAWFRENTVRLNDNLDFIEFIV